jgi:hypothetical protein
VKNTVQIAGKRVSRVICTYLGLVVGGLVDGRYLEVAGTTRERDREREKKAGRKNNNKKKKRYIREQCNASALMWRCTVHKFIKTLFWIQDR